MGARRSNGCPSPLALALALAPAPAIGRRSIGSYRYIGAEPLLRLYMSRPPNFRGPLGEPLYTYIWQLGRLNHYGG